MSTTVSAAPAAGVDERLGRAAQAPRQEPKWNLTTVGFLLPAGLFVGLFIVYPVIATVIRSFFNRAGDSFVGFGNYGQVVSHGRPLHCLQNNHIRELLLAYAATRSRVR